MWRNTTSILHYLRLDMHHHLSIQSGTTTNNGTKYKEEEDGLLLATVAGAGAKSSTLLVLHWDRPQQYQEEKHIRYTATVSSSNNVQCFITKWRACHCCSCLLLCPTHQQWTARRMARCPHNQLMERPEVMKWDPAKAAGCCDLTGLKHGLLSLSLLLSYICNNKLCPCATRRSGQRSVQP